MLQASNILKNDYPHIDGLQDTLLQQNLSWKVPTSDYVQILNADQNHWITITNIRPQSLSAQPSKDTVYVYDSLYDHVSEATKQLIAEYHKADKLKIKVMNVQQQTNNSDCGAYAVAFAKSILDSQDPTHLTYISPRQHLAKHLPNGKLPEFPSSNAQTSSPVKSSLSYYRLRPVNILKPRNYEIDILTQM